MSAEGSKTYTFDTTTIRLELRSEWSNDETQYWWDAYHGIEYLGDIPDDDTQDAHDGGFPSRERVLRFLFKHSVSGRLLSARERAEAERAVLDTEIAQAEKMAAWWKTTYDKAVAFIPKAVQTAEQQAAQCKASWEKSQARVAELHAQRAAREGGDTAAELLKIFTE